MKLMLLYKKVQYNNNVTVKRFLHLMLWS